MGGNRSTFGTRAERVVAVRSGLNAIAVPDYAEPVRTTNRCCFPAYIVKRGAERNVRSRTIVPCRPLLTRASGASDLRGPAKCRENSVAYAFAIGRHPIRIDYPRRGKTPVFRHLGDAANLCARQ